MVAELTRDIQETETFYFERDFCKLFKKPARIISYELQQSF